MPLSSPVTLIGLEEVDLTAHYCSFRPAMLETAAAVRRLRERSALAAVTSIGASAVRTAAAAAATAAAGDPGVPTEAREAVSGLDPSGHHISIVAITGTMTPSLERQTMKLFAIPESAYQYRAPRPMRLGVPLWVLAGPNDTSPSALGNYPQLVLDMTVRLRDYLAEENARSKDTRDGARREAEDAVAVAASAIEADRVAANMELASLTEGEATRRSVLVQRIEELAASATDLQRDHKRALNGLADRIGGLLWMTTSKAFVDKLHKKNSGDNVKLDMVAATLTGSDESNSKTRTMLAQLAGVYASVGVTAAGSIGLNWMATWLMMFKAIPSASLMVQTIHRVDRQRNGDGKVYHVSCPVHWRDQTRRLLARVAIAKKQCVGCTAATPVGRQRIAEVGMAERALAAARELVALLTSGGCIVVGLARALNPNTDTPSCRVLGNPPNTWCSACLTQAAGWTGSSAIPVGSDGDRELALFLDRVSDKGKQPVTYAVFERYINESTTFTDAKEKDRGDRSTPKFVTRTAAAVAEALAKVLLVEEVQLATADPSRVRPPRDGKREPQKYGQPGEGDKGDPCALYTLEHRFQRSRFFLADKDGGGFRPGSVPSPHVHPRLKLEHMESVLSTVESAVAEGTPMEEDVDAATVAPGAPPQPAAALVQPARGLADSADTVAALVEAIDAADNTAEAASKTAALVALCRTMVADVPSGAGGTTTCDGNVRHAGDGDITCTDDLEGAAPAKRTRGRGDSGAKRGGRGRGNGRPGRGKRGKGKAKNKAR